MCIIGDADSLIVVLPATVTAALVPSRNIPANNAAAGPAVLFAFNYSAEWIRLPLVLT